MTNPIFKNAKYKKRDYEATNIVAAEVLADRDGAPAIPPGDCWEPTDAAILDRLTPLYIQGGVRYYGYL